MSTGMCFIQRMLVLIGNTLTAIGCVGLALNAIWVIEPEHLVIGISSGIRAIGSVAIAGCLFSAIGYGILDLEER